MSMETILIDSLWAACFATAMTLIFSAPLWALAPSFLGGFVARFVRDGLMSMGMAPNLSILIAAMLAVTLSAILIRRPAVTPVVAVSSLMPLGAATAILRGILGMLKMSSLKGDALADTTVQVMANFAIGINTTIAIALGYWLGMSVVAGLLRAQHAVLRSAYDGNHR